MFKEHWKDWLRKKCTFKLMTVLFTPYRVYMIVIHINILRYSLIISFELNPIWREHMCFWMWFLWTPRCLQPYPMFWNQLLLPKPTLGKKSQVEIVLTSPLPGQPLRIGFGHSADTRSSCLMHSCGTSGSRRSLLSIQDSRKSIEHSCSFFTGPLSSPSPPLPTNSCRVT